MNEDIVSHEVLDTLQGDKTPRYVSWPFYIFLV